MILTDILRLTSQQRALYCYVGLSLWIFLLIAGTYKYIGSNDGTEYKQVIPLNSPLRDFPRNLKRDVKNKKIFTICNHPDDISTENEGILDPARWSLRGILIFIRHGDRGPLAHVRNISGVNCGNSAGPLTSYLLTQYKAFIQNITTAGHIPWSQSGPFHGFPILPLSQHDCQLAQLTYVGVAQLLNTGRLLNQAYSPRFPFDNLTGDDVLIYSTKYRRTFQSALALLYGLLPTDLFSKTTIKESQSVAFCFSDCACPAADHYRRLVKDQTDEHLHSHPAVMQLVQTISNIIYEIPDPTLLKDPHVLRDALLTYVCHDAPLPCLETDPTDTPICVRTDQVASLFAYTDWETKQYSRNLNLKRSCMLKAYGLIRNIVTQMLKMVSERKPKIVLYSGHDWTLQYLSTALGIKNDNALIQYASRLVIEIYRDDRNKNFKTGVIKEFYFRLIANGKDVTKDVHFCRGSNLLKLDQPIRTHVCRIEGIVRYIHDDYFSALNVTNFKDACRL